MVTATVYFDTHDPDGFLQALEGTSDLFEDVSGFHGFGVKRGVEDPARFLLLAEWDSVEAHQAWQAARANDFVGALNDYINGGPDIKHFV